MTVNIKDVARAAGVSISTVSRALGKGPVSAEVREQVQAAVKATGYRPNLSARRLRSQHTLTVGLIVADIRNPFFTAVSRAVEDAAYQAGMRVILCNTDEDPAREALYVRLMQEERVTGLIFAPTRATIGQLRAAPFDFPVVLIDRAGPDGQFDTVVLDNRAASAALVEHLAVQGYRRIGGLFGGTSTTGLEREAGFSAAMAAHGLAGESRFVAPNAAAAEAEAMAWLASPARPEALVLSNGLLLTGAVKAARAHGLRIPEDIGLAGFDNETWTGLVQPGLTVIEQPVETIGREAMALLFQRLKTPQAPTRKVVLSGTCLVRGSTAARAG
ncbi:LacI family DNA-binding transcriptional regulator [Ancylobacter lacus]|uniref:LacI family DNA-binding transcriptional regulator n=1 Tax=Ancylobacter lacus TaxID=2579970 RepID=UPI001BCF1A1E|nr:LacI family DNA-binding transcriptional regulator [Ancylobacter lacus]MBS7537981.1 LacI family DNA-binding transcriptional regulator [Ancylobacter lacus]